MSTQVTDNEPVLILDNEKYLVENLSETAKYIVANLQDVEMQIRSTQMKLDQLNIAKEGLTARLKGELQEPETVVETPTEDG